MECSMNDFNQFFVCKVKPNPAGPIFVRSGASPHIHIFILPSLLRCPNLPSPFSVSDNIPHASSGRL
ncbi:hypothetical protein RIF29_41014 [Crotalaria pallida]|uniref:Uncharacterized protein n=1 Tax=Crotalaria pallida TaxID=3830 RepID=A0AAN9E490_CROPI